MEWEDGCEVAGGWAVVEAGGGGRVVEVEEVTILLGSLLWLLRPGRK